MPRAESNIIPLKPKKPTRQKQSLRKKPDEWRAINRSARVKDGRALLLAVPAPRRAGELLVIEAYWCTRSRAWWAANCAPGLPGCDPLRDVYGMPMMWMPMPAPPLREAA